MATKLGSVIIVLILVVGGFLLFKDKSVAPTGEELNDLDVLDVSVESYNIKEFVIDAVPFSFSPSKMTVNKGDTVKITLRNINGNHDLKIDEFNAATRVLKTGETETITFVADKTGTFEYYCSVGNHRAMGMVGTLTVI